MLLCIKLYPGIELGASSHIFHGCICIANASAFLLLAAVVVQRKDFVG